MTNVPVFKPLIEADEIGAAVESLEMGWLGMGSYVDQLERALSEHLGLEDKRLALVNTGHSALHLAVLLAGVGPGDEVITPSFNCVSDFQAILQAGAEPVLCDIDDDSLTIDIPSAERMISKRTKAVLMIDYAASLADYEAVENFADKHGLRVIHDAAHSFNSTYKGRKIGSFSDLCMMSFDPVKTLTCLDAGAIIVNNDEELGRVHQMRILGMGQPPAVMYQNKRAWTFHVDGEGYRYHVLNLHAAIGLQQLKKIDHIAKTRQAACAYYLERLAGISDIRLPEIDLENITPFVFVMRIPAERRNDFRTALGAAGIDTGVHWQPGHHFKVLDGCRRDALPVSDKAGDEIVTLPLHSQMAGEDMAAVADAVVAYFKGDLIEVANQGSALEQIAAAE